MTTSRHQREPIDCDYVVIGGGFAGLHSARRLADIGRQVIVLERADAPMTGATRNNMGRVHLGWHYPGDLATALGCVPAALDFLTEFHDVMLPSHRETGDDGLPFHTSLFALVKGSFTSQERLLAVAARIQAVYRREVEHRSRDFGPVEDFFRIVDRADWDRRLAVERLDLLARTVESFVDLPAFTAKVLGEVRDHPGVTVLTGHEVTSAAPTTDGRVELRTTGPGPVVRANRVLNASWISRMRLDTEFARHAGVREPRGTTYRLRAMLRVRLPDGLCTLPSLLFAHGPFCTFTNRGDGTGLVMYEPVSNLATATDHVPADWWPRLAGEFTNEEHAHLTSSILAGAAEFVPSFADAEPLEVIGGAIYHSGTADIYDPYSDLHQRLGTGVRRLHENWLSLDSGKLAWVPRHVDEVVRIEKNRGN